MHILSLLVKAAVVARVVLATPLARRWDDFEVKHAWVDIPAGWERHADAPRDHVLNLKISLKQDKFDDLIDHLYQVSDPSHPRYVWFDLRYILVSLKAIFFSFHLATERICPRQTWML